MTPVKIHDSSYYLQTSIQIDVKIKVARNKINSTFFKSNL